MKEISHRKVMMTTMMMFMKMVDLFFFLYKCLCMCTSFLIASLEKKLYAFETFFIPIQLSEVSFLVFCMTILAMFVLVYFVFLYFLFVRCLEPMVDIVEIETLGMVWVEEHYNRPHRMI